MTTKPQSETASHTPGPWHRNIPPATHYPTVWSGRNKHVAYVTKTDLDPEEVEANIRLIASAPDLLAALLRVEQLMPATGISSCTEEQWECAKMVRDAINSATQP